MAGQGFAAPPGWKFEPGIGWHCPDLNLGSLFQLRINSQPVEMLELPPKDGADPHVVQGSFETEGFELERTSTWDEARQAIRVLDVFTCVSEEGSALMVEYTTGFEAPAAVTFQGKVTPAGREQEVGGELLAGSEGVVFLAEKKDSPVRPLFLWGQGNAPWPARLHKEENGVILGYQGTVPAKGKVALVHWIAAVSTTDFPKAERAFDAFFKDGRLVAPNLPAEVVPLVKNFTPEALLPAAQEGGLVGAPAAKGRLVLLETLLKRVGFAQGARDLIWTGRDEPFAGDITVGKVSLRLVGGREVVFPAAGVAAVCGGAGRGRAHRLYLRDGSVFAGEVVLEKGVFQGDIGSMAVNVAALDLLVWRTRPEDGLIPAGAREFVQGIDGTLAWIAPASSPSILLITEFGRLQVKGGSVWSMERRPEPPACLIVALADGSRIHGVMGEPAFGGDFLHLGPMQIPAAGLARWGAAEAWAKEMNPPGPQAKKGAERPLLRYGRLREGSLLAGTLAEGPLRLRVNFEDMTLQPGEITKILWAEDASALATIELVGGGKLRGQVLNETLLWQLGDQVLSLPAGMMREVVRKGPS